MGVFIRQKRVIRVLFGLECCKGCKQTFIEEKKLTISTIHILKCLVFARTKLGQFERNGSCHNHNTHHSVQLKISFHQE